MPGAQHVYLAHLEDALGGIDRRKTVATYCGTGYRASIAARLLQRAGFPKVVNIPGSWRAWTAAQFPVQHD